MLEIQITGTNIRYADDGISSVQVQFQGRDEQMNINLNGNIPLTAEEYQGNEPLESLKLVVKNKVIERLSPAV